VGLGYHRKMDTPPGFPLSREWRNHGPARSRKDLEQALKHLLHALPSLPEPLIARRRFRPLLRGAARRVLRPRL